MNNKRYYDLLGVPQDADDATIKKVGAGAACCHCCLHCCLRCCRVFWRQAVCNAGAAAEAVKSGDSTGAGRFGRPTRSLCCCSAAVGS